MIVGIINTHARFLPGGERPALMIIHFLRTFHSLRNTSNYVWSLSFLSHRMSWNTRLRSLISRGSLEACQDLWSQSRRGIPAPSAGTLADPLVRCIFSPAEEGEADPFPHTGVTGRIRSYAEQKSSSHRWPLSLLTAVLKVVGKGSLPPHSAIFLFGLKLRFSFKELLGLNRTAFFFLKPNASSKTQGHLSQWVPT